MVHGIRCVLSGHPKKDLTVVVAFRDMRREAPRTLASLAPRFQRGVAEITYEIAAIDIGSTRSLDTEAARTFGGNHCRHIVLGSDSASPAAAINSVVKDSRCEWIMCLIDGARMASPGVVRMAMLGTRLGARPFVYTLSMHLGSRLQNEAMMRGYDQQVEDELLAQVDWQSDGYSLFRISTVSPSPVTGFLSKLAETNCFLMRREDYLGIGGLSEEFQSPGGGLVNHDFFNRVHEIADFTPVMLLGEATFHQFHGGASTNVPPHRHPWASYVEEYRRIRGCEFRSKWRSPVYLGGAPEQSRHLFQHPQAAQAHSSPSILQSLLGKLHRLRRRGRPTLPSRIWRG